MLSLEETIDQILKHLPQYDKKDILEMIQKKREELGSDVINEESAAMIVARELGVDLLQDTSRGRFKIEDIEENARNVALTARVMRIDNVRTFKRKDGGEGKVASILVGDSTGAIRVALWDDVTRAVSEGHVSVGDVVHIRGAYVKKGLRESLELNLGRMGNIRVLEDYEVDDLDVETTEPEVTPLGSIEENMFDITILFKVAQVFGLSTFTRKSDGNEGKVLSLIGVDESGKRRIVFWDNYAEEMQSVKENEVVRVSGAYTRASRTGDVEIHSSRSSGIERQIKGKLESVETAGVSGFGDPLGLKKISDLSADMRDVDIEGKVTRIFDANTWQKDDREGKVQNIMIVDEAMMELRVTFWNEAVDLIKDLKAGDIIRIQHGYVKERDGKLEYQVGRRGSVEINPKDSSLGEIDISGVSQQTLMVSEPVRIEDIDDEMEGKSIEIRGIIVTMTQKAPYYLACTSCNKKVEEENGKFTCKTCGPVDKPEYRFAYSVTVDDGSGTMMVTFFGKTGERLLQMTAKEVYDLIEQTRKEDDKLEPAEVIQDRILGKYIMIRGRVNRNRLRNDLEITASYMEHPDLIEESRRVKESIDEMLS